MKVALAIVTLFGLALCTSFAEEQPTKPITILISHESPLRPKLNGEVTRLPEVLAFLKSSSKTSGRKDPITIRLENDGDIAAAASFAHLASKTHDSICIELSTNRDGRVSYVLPIAKDGVKLILDPRQSKQIIPVPADTSPNRAIDEQFNRFQKRASGDVR